MCAKSHQSCLTLCDPMDCSPAGSSVHGILQARILEWVVTTFSRGSSWPRDLTGISYISCMGRWVLYHYHHLGSPHPCMTIRKTISLTIWTFAGKVMSLLLNMLSRFVIAFLPSSTCLSIYQTSFYQTPKKRCILLLGQHEPRVIEIMKVEKMRALSTECFQRVKIGLYAGDGHPLSCYE